ncbi:MAG: hypothetical protein WCA12_07970, partial [Burkholderiales bacterium]
GEAEERARREGEEEARKDAERKQREEERARAKADAEAAARARKEERAREKASAEARDSVPVPSRAPEPPPAACKKSAKPGKMIAVAAVVAVAIGVGVLQFLPLDATFYERLAAEQFGAPVKIESASFSLLPAPTVKFSNVTAGSSGELRIASVKATPELGSMFGDRRVFKAVDLSGVNLSPAAAAAVLWSKPKPGGLTIERITGHDVKFALPGLELPPLTVDVQVGADGGAQRVSLASADHKFTAEMTPGPGKAGIEVNAAVLQVPFGSSLKLADFAAKGDVLPGELKLSEFDGRAWGGLLRGRGRLRWANELSFEGDIDVKQAEAVQLLPSVLASGRLLGQSSFTMRSSDPAKLFDVARWEGSFTVQKGQLAGIDLARMMQTGASTAGSTLFNELSGQGTLEPGKLSVRNARLTAGLLTATGSIDVDGGKALSGRVTTEMRSGQGTTSRVAFSVGGTPTQVVLKR